MPMRDFRLGPSAIPERIRAMEDPAYIRRRLSVPVSPGQIWLAKHGNGSQYVLVDKVDQKDARKIAVFPMSSDLSDATEDCLIAEATPLGMPMVVWPGLRAVIPVRLLFKPLDDLDDRTLQFLRSGNSLGVEAEPSPSAFRRRLLLRDRMDRWQRLCDALPQLHQSSTAPRPAFDADAPKRLIALIEVLGLTREDASKIMDGDLPLNDDQRRRLAAAGVSLPDGSADTTLPADLLIEVEQPEYRSMAKRFDDGNGDPRVALAKSVFSLAAKRTGKDRASWRGLLRQQRDEEGNIHA